MAHIDRRSRGGTIRYVARSIDPAGRERSKSCTRRTDAQKYLAEIEAAKLKGAWVDLSTAGPASATGMSNGGGAWSTCGRRRRNAGAVAMPRRAVAEGRAAGDALLSPAEIAHLADKIHPAYRALVFIGACGGLRIGELAAL